MVQNHGVPELIGESSPRLSGSVICSRSGIQYTDHPMDSRALVTGLKARLDPGELTSLNRVAKKVGVAANTLRGLVNDNWDQLSRETIERVCDYFACGPAELFQLTPARFWEPVALVGECHVLKYTDEQQRDRQADLTALALESFLLGRFPTVRVRTSAPRLVSDVPHYLSNHNCFVLGSPRLNAATEVALCRAFGVQPFKSIANSSQGPRFQFIVRSNARPVKSTLILHRPEGRRYGFGFGIWDTEKQQLVASTSTPSGRSTQSGEGRDAAMVLISNHSRADGQVVKTVVLAGCSSVGTEAALRAVMRDFRDLEPVPGARFVFGILEATYNVETRPIQQSSLTSYRWRYLQGSRKSHWRTQTRD